jgi:hypothetical protein
MPALRGDIWGPFHRSDDKPNGSHYRATHWRCIDAERPSTAAIDVELENDWELMKNEEWFATGALQTHNILLELT